MPNLWKSRFASSIYCPMEINVFFYQLTSKKFFYSACSIRTFKYMFWLRIQLRILWRNLSWCC